jgi:hypothetical protein
MTVDNSPNLVAGLPFQVGVDCAIARYALPLVTQITSPGPGLLACPFPGWDFRTVSASPLVVLACLPQVWEMNSPPFRGPLDGTGLPATRGVSGLRAVLVNLGWRVTGPPDPHSEPRVNMRSYPSVALLLTFNSCA